MVLLNSKGGRRAAAVMTLTLAVFLALCSCGKKTPTAFSEGTTLAGVDLGGLDAQEAAQALRDAAADYTLSVTLDGVEFLLTAAELGLSYNEELDLSAVIAGQGEEPVSSVDDLFVLDQQAQLQSILLDAYAAASAQAESEDAEQSEEETGEEAEEQAEEQESARDITAASIAYDEQAGVFVGVDGQPGLTFDYTQAVEDVAAAALNLEPQVSTASQQVESQGEKAAESAAVAAALETANRYLDLELTYSFTPAGGSTSYETVEPATIAGWLLVQSDGLSVELDTSAMASYCSSLASKYSVAGSNTAQFKTASGSYISVPVATAGQTVDESALYDDLYSCVVNHISGTRAASYSEVSETSSVVDFGGSYVEIDLTNQMVYCFKNGTLVVSSPCVTGSVVDGNATPTGVYTIKSKDTNRYLTGPGYKSWVNYFMPFNGGIGLHDASWRSAFGGTYYLYNGSHGCINMPYAAVKTIYENVSVGTKVIVYGGITSVEGNTQKWSGTKTYSATTGCAPFTIDYTPMGAPALTYTSSDKNVCTVSSDGTVTVVGAGTATITIRAAATAKYLASTATVTVTVTPPVQDQTVSGPDSCSVTAGSKVKLSCTASGGTALSYSSSNTAVCTVSSDGTVTGVSAGTATITVTAAASSAYNAASKTVAVTVAAPAKQTQKLTGTTSYTVQADAGSFSLDFTALGGAALSYSSSDNSVCTVSEQGVVTITGSGTATITVTAAETDAYTEAAAAVTVTVEPVQQPEPTPTQTPSADGGEE